MEILGATPIRTHSIMSLFRSEKNNNNYTTNTLGCLEKDNITKKLKFKLSFPLMIKSDDGKNSSVT